MTTKEKIAILQAYDDGKQIQIKAKPEHLGDIMRHRGIPSNYLDWRDNIGSMHFNFSWYDYRVKPEPREFIIFSSDEFGTKIIGVNYPTINGGEKIHVREIL